MSNMVVNTNILSLNAHRSMKRVGTKQAKASAKLSTGERINTAADDASGLAISEKMRAQIRGINKGSQNTHDGINLANVGDGGLDQVSNMLQRMRELTVQSANDTYTTSDREKIQKEIDELALEIDSTSEKVQFNKIKVLDGKKKVVEDNSTTTVTTNVVNSTTTDDEIVTYISLPKGTADYTNTTNGTYNSSSSSFTYTESEEYLGKVGDIANNFVPPIQDGYWKDCYQIDNITESTVVGVVEDRTTTETVVNVGPPTLNFPAVRADGVPVFSASSMGGAKTDLYCALTEAMFRDNTTGKITSLYDVSSVQTIDTIGNKVTNVFKPISGIEVTQTVTMGAGGYTVDFSFKNTSGAPVDFDFKFSMDAMNTYAATDTADSSTGTLENYDAKISMSGDADNTYYGSINNIISSFDVSTPGDFKGHSGAAFVWSNNLNAGETATGQMDYGIQMKNDYYKKTTVTSHDYETTTTITVDKMSQVTIPPQIAIQTGANIGEIMGIRLFDVDCMEMGLFYIDDNGNKKAGINVLTNEDCNKSLGTLDRTIDKVSSYRAYFGAKMNRMEHTINANEISELNLTDSESKIRDTDMAREMMELTKSNVLQSAAMSMLSQARTQPENLLQILR